MTAPPAHMPLVASARRLHLASSYLSPASSIASDTSFPWASMSSQNEPNAEHQRKAKSPSAKANDQPSGNGGLIFITGGTPAEFKSKKNMQTVRRKAMDAFLKGEKKVGKKSNGSANRSRLNSEDSNASKSSAGSHDGTTEPSTRAATLSHSTKSLTRTMASSRSSIVPSTQDQDAQSADGSLTRVPKPGDFVLPAAPIVLPSRKNVPLPYDAYLPPPFTSIGENIDPFKTMFQSSHPKVSVEYLKFHCSRYFGTRALGMYWIPTALSYPHTFLGTLCLATAYHDVLHEQPLESVQTIALRQEVIHTVGQNMLNPEKSASDDTLMAVIQLVISEIIGREDSVLKWHEDGMETMVKQRGGLNQLGVHGKLASSIAWVSLTSAILREAEPRSIYADFCAANSRKDYHITATIPESPIYRPRKAFKTLEKSPKCTSKALDLLKDICLMIDTFLQERKQSRRGSYMAVYKKITSPIEYPPVFDRAATNTSEDWKYEAIRIAAIIQATAIIQRVPLSEALTLASETTFLPPLNTSAIASQSQESLISPLNRRIETPATEYAPSPAYSPHSAEPFKQPFQSYFTQPTTKASFSSESLSRPSVSSIATRPSVSSLQSTSSEYNFFPTPPAPTPTNTTILLQNLRKTIEKSNMSDCWADMGGVLLWVNLVMGAATRTSEDKVLRKYFSALTMRAGIMLAFEHTQAINSTVLRMGEVITALNECSTSKNTSRKGSTSTSKKRRA